MRPTTLWRFVMTLLVLLMFCLFFVLLVRRAHSEHRDNLSWMRTFRGQNAAGCCAELDCAPTTVALLSESGDERLMLVGDTVLTLSSAWVHPSQDGKGYWCFIPLTTATAYEDVNGHRRAVPPDTPTRHNTRCVFYYSSQ